MSYKKLGIDFKESVDGISNLSTEQRLNILEKINIEKINVEIIKSVIRSEGAYKLFINNKKDYTEIKTVLDEINRLSKNYSENETKNLCYFFSVFDELYNKDTKTISLELKESKHNLDKKREEIRKRLIPWSRFFARDLDVTVFSLLFGFFGLGTANQTTNFLAIVIMYYLFYEPFLISTFGTTLGKYLYKIRVVNTDGSLLSFSDSFKRSVQVLYKGQALCIPVAILFTRIYHYRYYNDKGITLWDKELKINYETDKISNSRRYILNVAILIFSSFVYFLPQLIQMMELNK
tara:strand:+ start:208 stop:1083 length:876 start_codon:yes stop_codon:yes gene_type:complete